MWPHHAGTMANLPSSWGRVTLCDSHNWLVAYAQPPHNPACPTPAGAQRESGKPDVQPLERKKEREKELRPGAKPFPQANDADVSRAGLGSQGELPLEGVEDRPVPSALVFHTPHHPGAHVLTLGFADALMSERVITVHSASPLAAHLALKQGQAQQQHMTTVPEAPPVPPQRPRLRW